jgi:hypothetical protein
MHAAEIPSLLEENGLERIVPIEQQWEPVAFSLTLRVITYSFQLVFHFPAGP